jgi:citrate lyase subunit beta/citryl-CoA lyase
MNFMTTLFQTLLFAPANHPRKVAKALNLPVDVVIIDLEDACANDEKEKARHDVLKFLKQPRSTKAYVRVNSVSTSYFYKDITTIISPELDGIVLPKTESENDLIIAEWIISVVEKEYKLPFQSIDLIPLIETAKGVSNIKSILRNKGRVNRVAFGAGDFTNDIGMIWSKSGEELLSSRSQLVVESRAANIESPIDTVYVDLEDQETLAKETRLAKTLGFQGKLLIHPQQIDVVKEIFQPNKEEIEHAQKIIKAFQQAEASGSASIRVGKQFVDYPIVYRAQKILDLAQHNSQKL